MKATRLLLTLFLLSCGDLQGPRPQADLGIPTPPSVSLMACAPLLADSASATIGPEGGMIQVGPHTLSVPAGALADTVTITAVAPSDTVNRVQFQPQGLQFQQPAALTLSYANCNWLGSTLPKQVAYTTDALEILELLPTLDNVTTQTVTGQLSHFSDYAIAW